MTFQYEIQFGVADPPPNMPQHLFPSLLQLVVHLFSASSTMSTSYPVLSQSEEV